jgi:hypothetical protein
VEQAEIEKLINELEVGLDRLRSLYEQYFMGLERIEPAVVRKDVDRRVYVLRREQIRNTALRFRFQMLLQRYNTFQAHWQRICREIENGTYKRHLMRAQKRFGDEVVDPSGAARRRSIPAPGAPVAGDLAAELAELDREFAAAELDDQDVELIEDEPAPPPPPRRPAPATAPPPPPRPSQPQPVWRKTEVVPSRAAAQPPAPRSAAPAAASLLPPRPVAPKSTPTRAAVPSGAPTPARSGGDLPEERVRQLYAQYVDSKRKQNESTAAITYDAVAKSLRDSSAKLREKLGKAVDFEVRVKDGKTILKPVVK